MSADEAERLGCQVHTSLVFHWANADTADCTVRSWSKSQETPFAFFSGQFIVNTWTVFLHCDNAPLHCCKHKNGLHFYGLQQCRSIKRLLSDNEAALRLYIFLHFFNSLENHNYKATKNEQLLRALLITQKCHKCLLYDGRPVSPMNCLITRKFTYRQKVTTSSTF